MARPRVESLINEVIGAMRPDAPEADGALQARMAVVLRHLLEAVAEIKLTADELTALCGFLDRVAQNGEWRFLTHVFGMDVLVTEMAHGTGASPTVDNVEGPLYRPGAPQVSTPAVMMRADEPGERLFLSGQVFEAGTARPLAHAELDIWQSNALGAYAEDDPGQPAWNFRRRVITDAQGRYEIETIVPGCFEIGDLSGMACGAMMQRLGRHGWRPGHVHLKLAAPGMQPMTTMLYFEGDPWLDSDSIFSVRDEVVVVPVKHTDPAAIAVRGTQRPFQTATFDFPLVPASVPAQHRPVPADV